MAELVVHGRPVPTVFDLLGRSENDMTFALAWGMAQSGSFLADVIKAVSQTPIDAADAVINVQRHDAAGGFTDVEVTVDDRLHLIFEAKRGWNLPSNAQLRLYARRLDQSVANDRRLIVLTQWGAEEYVASRLGDWELDYPRVALGWSRLVGTDMSQFFPGVPHTDWPPHYVLTLGPPIRANHDVPNGPAVKRNARRWVDIDLLLTAPTITDALRATRERRSDSHGD